jgi:hypothetical protein
MSQSAVAYHPFHQKSIAASRDPIAYARALTLPFWMFTLQLPFWFVRDWTFWKEAFEFRTYYFVGFATCLVAHLAVGPGPWIKAPFQILSTWSGRFVTAFCVIAFVLSPQSLTPKTSALYAASTWGVYVLLHIFWTTDFRITQRMVVLAGMMILAWQVILCLKLGVHIGLSIGGILRNYTGQAALIGMTCCMLSPKKKIHLAGIAGAVFFSLLINSRGSLVAIAVFLVAYYGLYVGTVRAVLYTLLGSFLIVSLALVVPQLRNKVFEDVFHLHSENRGISSGFTGRAELNEIDSSFWNNAVFGYGFRQNVTATSVHSGYLKIVVETGFVGAFLIVGAVLIEVFRRFRVVQRIRDLPAPSAPHIDIGSSTRINVAAFAALCTTLTLWAYEPQYINLGSVNSLFFWLMMVAPAYITAQGTPIQR